MFGVLATVLSVIGAAVQANTSILDGLPPWAQSLILAILPTLLAAAAGYRVRLGRAEWGPQAVMDRPVHATPPGQGDDVEHSARPHAMDLAARYGKAA